MKGLGMLMGSALGVSGEDIAAAAGEFKEFLVSMHQMQQRQTVALESIARDVGVMAANNPENFAATFAAEGLTLLPGVVETVYDGEESEGHGGH